MTVAELNARISSEELTEWQAYYEVEPFGQVRGDLQAGIVASTIVNLFREKGNKAVQPHDYILKIGASPSPRQRKRKGAAPEWQGHLAFAQSMVAAGFGTITSGKET